MDPVWLLCACVLGAFASRVLALVVASSFLPFPGAPRCSSPPGRGDGPPRSLNPAAEPPARSLYASIKL